MAWVNCIIDGITTGTIADGSTKFYQYFTYSSPGSGVIPSDLSYSVSYTQSQLNNISYNTFLVGDNTNGGIKVGNYNNRHGLYINGYYNYQQWNSALYDANGNDCCIFAGINEETQKGTIFGFARWSNDRWAITDASCFNSEGIYHFLKNIQQILYTWQSVPSISGKNGILQNLVQLKNSAINSGEPVSNASLTSFDSLGNINIPSVIDGQMPVDPSDVTSVTATYLIPALENGTYEGIKLLVKKGSIPTSEQDADKVVNLDEPTSILRIDSKSVGNLDEDSHYYFVVKLVDEIGTEATSEPKDIWTSHDEGSSFDYTGQIQTFVAPQTGIYSLETWGAQGGNATDGTLTARGGYGAYAVGEVLLTQGDKLYINVGGQDGYNGGGNPLIVKTLQEITNNDISHYETLNYFQSDVFPYSLADGNMLFWKQTNGRPLSYNNENSYYYFAGTQTLQTVSDFAIPLPYRAYVEKITLEIGCFQEPSQYSRYTLVLADTQAQTRTTKERFNSPDTQPISEDSNHALSNLNTYYEFEITINAYADYIWFIAADGEFRFKNFKVYYR